MVAKTTGMLSIKQYSNYSTLHNEQLKSSIHTVHFDMVFTYNQHRSRGVPACELHSCDLASAYMEACSPFSAKKRSRAIELRH